jgi:hypothetical protein
LEWVLTDLYSAEVNCGVESFWDGGFTVFIGDEMNGRVAEETFYPDGNTYGHLPLSEAGNWLWLMSRRLYPALPSGGGPLPSSLAASAIRACGEQEASK